MFPLNRVERVAIFLVALNLYGLVTGDDLKDDNIDRGSRSDRGGLWFGPRLGKRSLRLVNDDNRQTFLRLLEAADALKYYYDQLSYESQADDPEMKVTKKVIFTPKLGRAVSNYEGVDFTPRLGRRLADDRVTPSDQDNYRSEVEQMDRNKYFSPRLGRTMNFSPRLGRELSYGFICLIVSISNGQVLIATDVEEFRNLAKKVVPGDIANKLVKIVSQNKYTHVDTEHQVDDGDNKEDDEYYYEGYDYEGNVEGPWLDEQYKSKTIARQGSNVPDSKVIYFKQQGKPAKVNLDDLVEKVRERLLDDFQKNPTELQKLLGAQSVIAHFKNESNHQNINTEKLKLLHDRHDENENQRFRPGTRQNISRPQPIKIERKDTRFRPAQRFSGPLINKIERKDVQGQAYEEGDLSARHRPGPRISKSLLSNKEGKDSQGHAYEEEVMPERYKPGQKMFRPQLVHRETMGIQEQAYEEAARYEPVPKISGHLSSNIQIKDSQGQVYVEDDLNEPYRSGPSISKSLLSNRESKGSPGHAYQEDDMLERYKPGPKISRPQLVDRETKDIQEQTYEEVARYAPAPKISRPLSSNRPIKDSRGQAHIEDDLPEPYRPEMKISRSQASNRERKDATAQEYKHDDLPEVDAEGNIRVPKDQRQTSKPELIFQEFNLNAQKDEKDTYEDYVTPKKEENIFATEEAETRTTQSSPHGIQDSKQTQKLDIFNYKLQNLLRDSSQTPNRTNPKIPANPTISSIYDDSNETTTEPDLKARTENLWFDYKDEPVAKVMQTHTKVSDKRETKKVKVGTMIPTRETYKMTSPNYYGQLPTVAEKYNFDEPIPERDREIEDLRPIGNPPANINGKIKV